MGHCLPKGRITNYCSNFTINCSFYQHSPKSHNFSTITQRENINFKNNNLNSSIVFTTKRTGEFFFIVNKVIQIQTLFRKYISYKKYKKLSNKLSSNLTYSGVLLTGNQERSSEITKFKSRGFFNENINKETKEDSKREKKLENIDNLFNIEPDTVTINNYSSVSIDKTYDLCIDTERENNSSEKSSEKTYIYNINHYLTILQNGSFLKGILNSKDIKTTLTSIIPLKFTLKYIKFIKYINISFL